ncbi:hypothetical protein Bbelb_127640 [Branchiostoma belcheri]|nr:hypothetical protein Bbelb_127640 [Branchiostoma belcheri]
MCAILHAATVGQRRWDVFGLFSDLDKPRLGKGIFKVVNYNDSAMCFQRNVFDRRTNMAAILTFIVTACLISQFCTADAAAVDVTLLSSTHFLDDSSQTQFLCRVPWPQDTITQHTFSAETPNTRPIIREGGTGPGNPFIVSSSQRVANQNGAAYGAIFMADAGDTRVGAFSCSVEENGLTGKAVSFKIKNTAFTVRANVGESATLRVSTTSSWQQSWTDNEVRWSKDGQELQGRQGLQLTIDNVQTSDGGIYEAYRTGERNTWNHAFSRLIHAVQADGGSQHALTRAQPVTMAVCVTPRQDAASVHLASPAQTATKPVMLPTNLVRHVITNVTVQIVAASYCVQLTPLVVPVVLAMEASACSAGTFGAGCTQTCNCIGTCNMATGACDARGVQQDGLAQVVKSSSHILEGTAASQLLCRTARGTIRQTQSWPFRREGGAGPGNPFGVGSTQRVGNYGARFMSDAGNTRVGAFSCQVDSNGRSGSAVSFKVKGNEAFTTTVSVGEPVTLKMTKTNTWQANWFDTQVKWRKDGESRINKTQTPVLNDPPTRLVSLSLVLNDTPTRLVSLSLVLNDTPTRLVSLSLVLNDTPTRLVSLLVSLSLVLNNTPTRLVSLSLVLNNTPTRLVSLSLVLNTHTTRLVSLSLVLNDTPTRLVSLSLVLNNTPTRLVSLSLVLNNTPTRLESLSLVLNNTPTRLESLSLVLNNTPTRQVSLCLVLNDTPTRLVSLSLVLNDTPTRLVSLSLVLNNTPTRLESLSLVLNNTPTRLESLSLVLHNRQGLQLAIPSVQTSDAGIYEAYRDGEENNWNHAFSRLIVRELSTSHSALDGEMESDWSKALACPTNKWGPDCRNRCPVCYNGGVCHAQTGRCVCAPGFHGDSCQSVCDSPQKFGSTCQATCADSSCQRKLLCPADPFGCTCGPTYTGVRCDGACPDGRFGPGCTQMCHCKGTCTRATGCVINRVCSRLDSLVSTNAVDFFATPVENRVLNTYTAVRHNGVNDAQCAKYCLQGTGLAGGLTCRSFDMFSSGGSVQCRLNTQNKDAQGSPGLSVNTGGKYYQREDLSSCSYLPCANGATCLDRAEQQYTCICSPGWMGTNCDLASSNPLDYFAKYSGSNLEGNDAETIQNVASSEECARRCLQGTQTVPRERCQSFDYRISERKCFLSTATKETNPQHFRQGNADLEYYQREASGPCSNLPCQLPQRCQTPASGSGYQCFCPNGRLGPNCNVEAQVDVGIESKNYLVGTANVEMYCRTVRGNIIQNNINDVNYPFTREKRGKIDIGNPLNTSLSRKIYNYGVFLHEPAGDLRLGPFSCQVQQGGQTSKVVTLNMKNDAKVKPNVITQTVNVGERATLSVTPDSGISELTWHRDGDLVTGVQTNEYTINSVRLANAGVYEVFQPGQYHRYEHAFMRLIVRGCTKDRWGPPDCLGFCPVCQNGGVCDDATGVCVCAPGFRGVNCEKACPAGFFGPTCQSRCTFTNCREKLICLPDPYGCSCAAGFKGLDCNQECDVGTFGPGCTLTCNCQSGGCSSTTGSCTNGCKPGWSGDSCQIASNSPIDYFSKRENHFLLNGRLTELTDTSVDECARRCVNTPECKSINYFRDENKCWLNNKNPGEGDPAASLVPMNTRDNYNREDFSGCSMVPCLNQGACSVSDTPAEYSCTCAPGFTGSTCSEDVNECLTNNGQCDHRCTNTRGSFTCSCDTNFLLGPDMRTCIVMRLLKPNSVYPFRVRARSQHGWGGYSKEVNCTVPPLAVVPLASAPERNSEQATGDRTIPVWLYGAQTRYGSVGCYQVVVVELKNGMTTDNLPQPQDLEVFNNYSQANASGKNYTAYVAAAHPGDTVGRRKTVTLGDGRQTSCQPPPTASGSRVRRALTNQDVFGTTFTNNPLNPSTPYTMTARAFSPQGNQPPTYSSSAYMSPVTTAPPAGATGTTGSIFQSTAGKIAAGLIGGALFLCALIPLLYFCWKADVPGVSAKANVPGVSGAAAMPGVSGRVDAPGVQSSAGLSLHPGSPPVVKTPKDSAKTSCFGKKKKKTGGGIEVYSPAIDARAGADLNAPSMNVRGPNIDANAPQLEGEVDLRGPNARMKKPKKSGGLNCLKKPKKPKGGIEMDTNIRGPQANIDARAGGELNAPSMNIRGPRANIEAPHVQGDVDLHGPNVHMKKPKKSGGLNCLKKPKKPKGGIEMDVPDVKGNVSGPKMPDVDVKGPKMNVKGPEMPDVHLKGPNVDMDAPKYQL